MASPKNDNYVRLGIYLTQPGYKELQEFAKTVPISQAAILEAAVRYVPRDVLIAACEKMWQERSAEKKAKSEAKRLLNSLSPAEIAELLKKAR